MQNARKTYLILGDDARQENLAKLCGTIPFKGIDKDLKKQIKHSNIIVMPIGQSNENIMPELTKHTQNNSFIIGGNLSFDFVMNLTKKGCNPIDILDNKDFVQKNAALTAQGAIEIAKSESVKELEDCKCLILGYGNCGKAIEKELKDLNSKVEVYDKNLNLNIEDLIEKLCEYNIIFNTIPEKIFDNDVIEKILENSIIINIASHDAGFPKEMRFPNIPAKMFPKASASILKEIIDKQISEEEANNV